MTYLADTNIFLEILLDQEKRGLCENFLQKNIGRISLSDFSFHSIGVILFRGGKENIFEAFTNDIIPLASVLSLPVDLLNKTVQAGQVFNFDFDDAYQYCLADYFGLQIVTMDKDFSRLESSKVILL
jgi:predicted nucleic acid-binding protein